MSLVLKSQEILYKGFLPNGFTSFWFELAANLLFLNITYLRNNRVFGPDP